MLITITISLDQWHLKFFSNVLLKIYFPDVDRAMVSVGLFRKGKASVYILLHELLD